MVGISNLEADRMDTTSIPIMSNRASGKSTPVEEDAGFGYKMDTHARFAGVMGKSVRNELKELLLVLTTKIRGAIGGTSVAERLAIESLCFCSATGLYAHGAHGRNTYI